MKQFVMFLIMIGSINLFWRDADFGDCENQFY